MSKLNLVIRKPDETIVSLEILSTFLPQLVTNKRLYDCDMDFVNDYISKVYEKEIQPLPIDDGILVIDFVDKIIFDSQAYTGINKITPAEIKMSKRGNVPGETSDNSIIKRFKELVEARRLKGFEEWYDNGTGMNRKVTLLDYEELIQTTLEANVYGQFVFDTSPFKVLTFNEMDYSEQYEMYGLLKKHGIITNTVEWEKYLQGLK